MNKLKTFPNVFWITINLAIVLFFISLVLLMASAIIKNENFAILIPLLIMLLFAILFYYQLSNHFIFISKNETGIKVSQPMKFKIVKLNWTQIKGYSVSEVWFGKNLYSSKSFVIYTKEKEIFEIIKICNFGFEKMLLSFEDRKIENLGTESYQTGIFKRKYKF